MQKFRHIMADAKDTLRPKPGPKKPTLTHFLCLPLVNSASISQLESSLARFRSTHLLDPRASRPNDNTKASHLGLPDKAFRPLGTLHLTLGVMSLHTKERLEQASSLLKSLDLAGLMVEAERIATHSPHHSDSQPRSSNISHNPQANKASTSPGPFTISLESLTALPRAKSATALYASPIDPTGRLYPFCVMLRDKFIEAGLIQIEPDRKPREANPSREPTQAYLKAPRPIPSSGDASSSQPAAPKNPDPYTMAMTRRPKPRPLLLHATLVNTIYVGGRQQNHNKNAKNKTSSKRITFDARNLVSQSTDSPSVTSSTSAPSHTYIWAKDIPLDTICICEMGAKKLRPSIDDHGWSERLGEQYLAVAQRSLRHVADIVE